MTAEDMAQVGTTMHHASEVLLVQHADARIALWYSRSSATQLEALVTLDFAFKFINMTAEDMAQVRGGRVLVRTC
jgi:hypothetical protein